MIFKDALKEILVTSRESFLSRVWLIIYGQAHITIRNHSTLAFNLGIMLHVYMLMLPKYTLIRIKHTY